MFISGKMFPTGYLSEQKWRIHVFDIVNFSTNDMFLTDLMNFDAEQFLIVIAKLFYG